METKTIKDSQTAIELNKQGKNFNLKTDRGFIFRIGDILSKIEDNQHYVFSSEKKQWEKIIIN